MATENTKSNRGWKQGLYKPNHPQKYKGDITKIVFRSSWELSFAKFLDGNPNVLEWASEEFFVTYFNPSKRRNARYYPDFWVKYQNKHGEIIQEVIEVKPHSQVQRPKGGNKYNQMQWFVNMAKWEAAIKFCKERNLKFRVLTEKSMFK